MNDTKGLDQVRKNGVFSTLPQNRADVAVWMAERFGWETFPVGPDKKPFAGTQGFRDASNDPSVIQIAFSTRPNANVAIATGAKSGFFVVDVDIKNGVGWAGLEEFEKRYGALPETLTVETASGGRHYYFAYPPRKTIRNRVNLYGLHIDIRGDGGYVLAPPSVLKDGGSYTVLVDAPIATAPDWLIARLEGNEPSRGSQPAASAGQIKPGGRNNELCSMAGALRRRGATEEAIASALHALNEAQCTPPLPRTDVEKIARSVARYAPASGHPDTDLGNARRLVDSLDGRARFDHASRAWFTYDGQCWRRDGDGALMRAAKEVGDRLLAEAQMINDHDTRKRRTAFALKSQASTRVRAIVELAQSEPGVPIPSDAFDRPPHLLNVRNGTIDLRNGTLHPHNLDDLLSRIVEIDYDADAKCPTWDRFIAEVFQNDADLIEFVHRAIGYCATGETREQMFMILHGDGANGKSTLLRSVSDALGPYASHTPTETLIVRHGGQSNDVARLMGARFVTASEADSNQRLNEGFIKQVTGDEPITARYLYGEFFTFNPMFKLALATNALPAVNGADPALFRRLRLISFNRVFAAAEQDRELGTKLAAELPGILAWIVRGAVKWYADGLTTPAAVLLANAEFRSDSDTVGTYIDERCELVPGEETQASHLFGDYRRFTDNAGREPLNQTAFGRALNQRGIHAEKRSGSSYRIGIKITSLAA